jgi:hypothetical protein
MSSQVPIWVPIAVALLGVAGVLLGQHMSARREDRRWSREQRRDDHRIQHELEREELRWQRARHAENTKIRLEQAHQWHEIKIKTYGTLIQSLNSLQRSFWRLQYQLKYTGRENDSSVFDDEERKISEIRPRLLELLAEIHIIGSTQMLEIRENIAILVFKWSEFPRGLTLDMVVDSAKLASDTIDYIRKIARIELNIDPPEIADESSRTCS